MHYKFTLPIPKLFVKNLLWVTQIIPESHLVIVCKGYDEDDENYTALYWNDDAENCRDYSNYRIWLG